MSTDRRTILALDVDGVVIDATRGGAGPWTNELTARFGVDPALLRDFFTNRWPDVVTGRRPIEPVLEAWLAEQAWDLGVEDILACWFEADCCPNEPVLEAASAWATEGIPIVLVTNQEHRRAAFLRQRLQLRLEVRDIVYSAALGVTKPDPRFFAAADRHLAVDPEKHVVVFVDDLQANVDAAGAHGWRAVHYDGTTSWRDQVALALSPARPRN